MLKRPPYRPHQPEPYFYRPSFSRHLHSLAVNGFYARTVDADDYEFLERVRQRGIANGDLPNNSAVMLEELNFWDMPYGIEIGVERRAGPAPRRMAPSPEQLAMRQARSDKFRAERIIKQQSKIIADAELERERREWLNAKKRRAWRETMSDADWEAAAPAKKKSGWGKTVNRHYVPQWRLDEAATAKIEKAKAAKLADRERRDTQAAVMRAARQWNKEARLRAELESAQGKIDEARATLRRVDWQMLIWQQTKFMCSPEQVRQNILSLIKGSHPYVWTRGELMRASGCPSLDELNEHITQLIKARHIKTVE